MSNVGRDIGPHAEATGSRKQRRATGGQRAGNGVGEGNGVRSCIHTFSIPLFHNPTLGRVVDFKRQRGQVLHSYFFNPSFSQSDSRPRSRFQRSDQTHSCCSSPSRRLARLPYCALAWLQTGQAAALMCVVAGAVFPRLLKVCAPRNLCCHGFQHDVDVPCTCTCTRRPVGPCEMAQSGAISAEIATRLCIGAALPCQRRTHQPIIRPVCRDGKFQSPLSTASQAVQSNEVYLPQEVIDDLRRLGATADKR